VLKKHYQLFVSLLLVADALVIVMACYAAWGIRRIAIEGFWAPSWENWLIKEPLWIFALPIGITVFQVTGLYRPRRDRSVWSEQLSLFRASLMTVGLIIVALWALGNEEFLGGKKDAAGNPLYGTVHLLGQDLDAGRVQIGSLAILLPVFLGVHRLAFRSTVRAVRRRGWNLRHAAIIGSGRLGQMACWMIDRNSWTGIDVNYFITHHETVPTKPCAGRDVLGTMATFEQTLERHKVDVVYVALPNRMAAEVPSVLHRLERFPVEVRIIPDVNPRYVPQNMVVGELDGMPILSYRESPMAGFPGFVKRCMDVLGALAAMVVFGPVMLVVAALIALTSPGPVIFRQKRVGLGGREFNIYKFRTMRWSRETAPAAWTKPGDKRVTRVGRVLRRTSLDELPQLFNVLKGDMALVGPRPERPELMNRFKEDWRGYMVRVNVKAGITGWAQVNGLRGNTSLRKRIQYDLFYVRNWSLWLDLRILWLTVFRGFMHRNAH